MSPAPLAPRGIPRCPDCGWLFAGKELLDKHRERCTGRAAVAIGLGDPIPPLRFELPLPPNMNERRFRQDWKPKRRYHAKLDQLVLLRQLPAAPFAPLERVKLRIELRTSLAMDQENAELRASKWPLDWLVSRGYLADDGPGCIERGPVEQRRCPRKSAGVLIEIFTA